MANKFTIIIFTLVFWMSSSEAKDFMVSDTLLVSAINNGNIDSVILETPENYSCSLIHNAFPVYDVLISKPSGYQNFLKIAGEFNYGNNSYSSFLNTTCKSLLDTGISISKLNVLLGTNREQIVFLDHSQRISKYVKINIMYHSIVSLGFLTNELSKSKTFSFELRVRKKQYENSFGFNYRKIDTQENGGIVNGQNTSGLTKNKFDLLSVQLASDKSLSAVNEFYLNQDFWLSNKEDLKKKILIEFNSNYRMQGWSYSGTSETGYYKNIFHDSVSTFDSSTVIDLNNKLNLHLFKTIDSKKNTDISIGLNNHYLKVKQNAYLLYPNILSSFFRMGYKLNQLKVNIGVDWNIAGDINQGDKSFYSNFYYQTKGDMLSEVSLNIYSSLFNTDYIFEKLSTNHFEWNSNFGKQSNHNLLAEVGFFKNRIYLFGNHSILKNYIYLNEKIAPVQTDEIVNINSLGLKWNTSLINKVFFSGIITTQKSDKAFIRVPEYKSYVRFSYKNRFFNKALLAEIGMAFLYTSSYYSDAYVPSIGQVYLQNSQKTDGYPYFHLFTNFTIGSAQLYLKLEHINNGLSRGPSMVGLGYPSPPRTLKFGLIWTLRN